MGKDDKTWLNISYLAFGLLVYFVSTLAVETMGLHYGWVERYDSWYPLASKLMAIAIGAGSAFYFNSNRDYREYHLSIIAELRKVKWPTFEDTKKMTTIVVVVVAIFAVILSVFDLLWSKTLQLILP